MKHLNLIFALLVPFASFAEDKSVVFPDTSLIDKYPKADAKLSVSCKTAEGKDLKNGDIGYDECVRKMSSSQTSQNTRDEEQNRWFEQERSKDSHKIQ